MPIDPQAAAMAVGAFGAIGVVTGGYFAYRGTKAASAANVRVAELQAENARLQAQTAGKEQAAKEEATIWERATQWRQQLEARIASLEQRVSALTGALADKDAEVEALRDLACEVPDHECGKRRRPARK